jgi:hypothetical protein
VFHENKLPYICSMYDTGYCLRDMTELKILYLWVKFEMYKIFFSQNLYFIEHKLYK